MTFLGIVIGGALVASPWARAEDPTITWTGASPNFWELGLWGASSNWDLGRVPATGDRVVIPGGSYVEYNAISATTSVSSIDCQGSIVVSSGALLVSTPSTISTLYVAGGTYGGTSATTVTARLDWYNAGRFSGSGTTVVSEGATLAIGGSGMAAETLLDGHTLVNRGYASMSSGSLYVYPGTTFENAGYLGVSGTTTRMYGVAAGSSGLVRNTGTLQAAAGTGNTLDLFQKSAGAQIPLLTNEGTISCASGKLLINQSVPTTHAGAWAPGASGTIEFPGNSFYLGPSSLVSGPGTLSVTGAAIVDDGPVAAGWVSVASTGTLAVNGSVDCTGVVVTGGSAMLRLNGPSQTRYLTLATSGIMGGSGDVTVTGAAYLSGTATDTGRLVVGPSATLGLALVGPAYLNGRTLQNLGTANLTGSYEFYVQRGAVLDNRGTFNMGPRTLSNGVSGTIGRFDNLGSFIASPGAGSHTRIGSGTPPLVFTNDGTVRANSGTLVFQATSSDATHTGTFDASGTIEFYLSKHAFAPSSTLMGKGAYTFSGATANVNGVFDSPAATITAGTVTMNGSVETTYLGISGSTSTLYLNSPVEVDRLLMDNATLRGSGDVTVTGNCLFSGTATDTGRLVVGPSATLGLALVAPTYLNGRTLQNLGTANLTGSYQFYVQRGAVLDNRGTFNMGPRTLSNGVSGTIGRFDNLGSFIASPGAGSHTRIGSGTPPLVFTNDGTVRANNGTLVFQAASSDATHTGTFDASGTIEFNQSKHVFENGSSLSGTGAYLFTGSTANVNCPYDTAATTVTAGTVTMNGSVETTSLGVAGGTLHLNSSVESTVAGISSSGVLYLNDAEELDRLVLTGTGILRGSGDVTVTSLFNFSGTASDTAKLVVGPSATLGIGMDGSPILNGRTLTNLGTATLTGGYNLTLQKGAVFDNLGTLTIGPSRKIGNDSASSWFNNKGILVAAPGPTGICFIGDSGAALVFTNTGTTRASNGILRFDTRPVNSGTFALGGGEMTPMTGCTQTATGVTAIDVSGTVAGTGYKQMKVTGQAALDGILHMTMIRGYDPTVGTTFVPLTYTSRTGAFASVTDTMTTKDVTSTYNSGNLTLTVIDDVTPPEPPVIAGVPAVIDADNYRAVVVTGVAEASSVVTVTAWNGASTCTSAAPVTAGGQFSVIMDLAPVPDGTVSFGARSRDAVGNVSATSTVVTRVKGTAGAIEGTVTGGAGNLTGIKVHAYRQDGSNWIWSKSALTSSGAYTLSDLAIGTYRLWFQDRSGTWVSEYYENAGSFGLATGVTVTAGGTTTMDADLAGAGTISGTVTGGAGDLSGIKVHAYKQDGSSWIWTRSALTASGAYNLTNLPAGTYRLWFQDPTGTWASEYHDNTPSFDSATGVTVTAGGTTTIDADLAGAGTISGTVTGGAGNLTGIKVHAYKQDGSSWVWTKSALSSSGSYTLSRLPAGTYRLWFQDPTGTWASEYYENTPSFGLATGVTVTAGGTTTVDADLAGAGTISGTVTGGAGNLSGIKVHAYKQDGSNWIWMKSALTSSGAYSLGNLPAGTYRLWFYDPTATWVSEYYENVTSFGLATGVTVTAGGTTTIDADLAAP